MPDGVEHSAVNHSSIRHARLQLLKSRTTDQSLDQTRQVRHVDVPTRSDTKHDRISTLIRNFRQAPPRPKQDRDCTHALRDQRPCTSDTQAWSTPATQDHDRAAPNTQQRFKTQLCLDRLRSNRLQHVYNDEKVDETNTGTGSEDILQAWRRNRYQGKQVSLSSLQTASCIAKPSSLLAAAAHSATPPSASAVHAGMASPAPAAYTAGLQRHPTASQLGLDAMLSVVESAPCATPQEHHPSLVLKVNSQHTCGGSSADAALEAIQQAGPLLNAKAINRMSEGASTATSVDRAPDSHTHQPVALLPSDAHQPGVATGTCKVQDTLMSPQLLLSATGTLPKEPSPRGPSIEGWSASMPSHTDSSATARSLPEPPASARLPVNSPSTEAAATGPLQAEGCTPDTKEALLSQLSSIFGSPKASASDKLDDVHIDADSDSAASSPVSVHSQANQVLPRQQSTAASLFDTCTAACTDTCLVALREHLLEPRHQVGTACVASPGLGTLSSTLPAGVIEQGFAESQAEVGFPPGTLSAVVSASGGADQGVVGPCLSGSECLPAAPGPAVGVPQPAPPVSDATDTTDTVLIGHQDAISDVSWEASRASVAQRRHSSNSGSSLSSSLTSLLGDTVAATLFTEDCMPTLPAPPQTSYLVSATQAQPSAACTSSEQNQAVEDQPQRQMTDPVASKQEPSASVREISPVPAVAVDHIVGMCQQSSNSVHHQLSTASRREASNQPAHGVTDSLTDGEAACVTDSRTNSVADGCMDTGTDGGTDIAVCAAASGVARQHHSCCGAGGIGTLRARQDHDLAGQDLDLAGHECYTHRAGQEKLTSVEDGLGGNPISASTCPVDTICSASSSIACSDASPSTAGPESSSHRNTCSQGHASPVPSEASAALRPSVDDANPGSSVPDTAQLRIADAQTDMQPVTSNALAASNPEASAAAVCNEAVSVASIRDSSASEDAQASSASGSVTSSSAGSDCVDLQTADSGAGQADELFILPVSTTDAEADLAQAGCAASPSARVAHDGCTGSGELQVALQGGGESPMPAEPLACPPFQLITIGTGDKLTAAPAQLGIVGQGVSIATGMLVEASGSRVAATLETAVLCEAQTQLVEIGVQTDASMSLCMLETRNKGDCSGVDRVVEVRADTGSVGSAQLVSASDSSSHSKPAARQAAASPHSLAAEAAESGSAGGPGLAEDDRASSAVHAPHTATHSKANGTACKASGNQMCLSNVVTSQFDGSCQSAAQAGLCRTNHHQSESRQYTSSSETSVVSNQALACLLELVTACGGHDSLKELIRADMCCFPYERDSSLMSVCGQIRDSFDRR